MKTTKIISIVGGGIVALPILYLSTVGAFITPKYRTLALADEAVLTGEGLSWGMELWFAVDSYFNDYIYLIMAVGAFVLLVCWAIEKESNKEKAISAGGAKKTESRQLSDEDYM